MPSEITADLVVLGGGPAGIAAAVAARRSGIGSVLLLEREGSLGGATRHCGHPPFGMREFGRVLTGSAYASRLATLAATAGVDVRLRHSVVSLGPAGCLEVASPAGLSTIAGRRVILATGARETPRSARLIGGDRPLAVLNTGAFQAYVHLHGLLPFKRPVIVGTELVSLSAVWTCLSKGIRPVMVIEPGPRSVARRPLALFPRLARIPMRFSTQLVGIEGDPRVSGVVIRDDAGRTETVSCDGVLLTGAFLPEASLVRSSVLDLDTGSGGPVIDQAGRCSDAAYFATGNLLRPIETAGWCFREGRRTGEMAAADHLGRLSPARHAVPIERGPGIKLVVPQRVSWPLGERTMRHLQVRLVAPHHGRLNVVMDGAVVWSTSLRQRPDRRILIPLDALAATEHASAIRLELV